MCKACLVLWAAVGVVMCVLAGMSYGQARAPDDIAWVQIEAYPSLRVAQERVQIYAQTLEDVNGFALPGGWYGIALGPYRRADANQVLQAYRRDGLIPGDSYLSDSDYYRQQFFPVGADILSRGVIAAPAIVPTPQPAAPVATAPQDTLEPQQSEETPAQARRGENALSREERRQLQVMLRWAGVYNAAIDGAFGRGTRRAMSDWQAANGHQVTGILTTAQRAKLTEQYNAVLEGVDLEVLRDEVAGIEMLVPKGLVKFEKYEYPFVHFEPISDAPIQVLMISQRGDQTTLYGLYDIMQTLEIVPLDGARERRKFSFTLIGEDETIISHTEAGANDGAVKGFTLVWPTGDEERRRRVLDEMRASFKRLDGVMDADRTDLDEQGVDLISGLRVRTPRLSRSGFFVDARGRALTTLEAVQNCTRITVDDDTEMQVTASNVDLGLALLTPQTAIAPPQVALFSTQPPRLQSQIAVSGFSYSGVLGAPTMSFGRLGDVRGLNGDVTRARLEVATLDGDAGGPVFDEAGAVMGVALPKNSDGRQLPDEVTFAAQAGAVKVWLAENGVSAGSLVRPEVKAPEDITAAARDMTVLVSCWD